MLLAAIEAYWMYMLVTLGVILALWAVPSIYRALNPQAKARYLEDKAEKEAQRAKEERREAEAIREQEKLSAERKAAEKEKTLEAHRRIAEERRRKEAERAKTRDADAQSEPFTYQIGTHANEALAIRYGIANLETAVKEYWYYAKGGIRKRDPDRDTRIMVPAKTIRLQKAQKIAKDRYEVLLSDFRDRKAIAIIESGQEYVKTFYPLDDIWFEKHKKLEETLKGNGAFSLKELATFHIQKAVN